MVDQHDVIGHLQRVFEPDRRVSALFLSGSLGRGAGDAQSDIDCIAVVATEHQADILEAWRAAIAVLSPVVHWQVRHSSTLLANAVTADWTRVDVTLLDTGASLGSSRDRLRPLIDRDSRYAALPPASPALAPDGATVARLVAEFIRVLGLAHVVVARDEMVVAVAGVSMLRAMLVELMKQKVAVPDRGGMLHLKTLLPAERMRLLEALPYPRPDRAEVIAANLAIARAFFRIARPLAADLALPWPTAFEAAARRVFTDRLGIPAVDLW